MFNRGRDEEGEEEEEEEDVGSGPPCGEGPVRANEQS